MVIYHEEVDGTAGPKAEVDQHSLKRVETMSIDQWNLWLMPDGSAARLLVYPKAKPLEVNSALEFLRKEKAHLPKRQQYAIDMFASLLAGDSISEQLPFVLGYYPGGGVMAFSFSDTPAPPKGPAQRRASFILDSLANSPLYAHVRGRYTGTFPYQNPQDFDKPVLFLLGKRKGGIITKNLKQVFAREHLDEKVVNGMRGIGAFELVGGDTSFMKALSNGKIPIFAYADGDENRKTKHCVNMLIYLLQNIPGADPYIEFFKLQRDNAESRDPVDVSYVDVNFVKKWRDGIVPIILKKVDYAQDAEAMMKLPRLLEKLKTPGLSQQEFDSTADAMRKLCPENRRKDLESEIAKLSINVQKIYQTTVH